MPTRITGLTALYLVILTVLCLWLLRLDDRIAHLERQVSDLNARTAQPWSTP